MGTAFGAAKGRHSAARRPSRWRRRPIGMVAAAALVAGALAYPLGTASRVGAVGGSLPAGTGIGVSLDSPAEGAVLAPGTPVSLSGTASVDQGVGTPNTAMIYAVDVASAATSDVGQFEGLCRGQVQPQNSSLDCQANYMSELNNAAISGGGVALTAAIAYSGFPFLADMVPGDIVQDEFTTPAAGRDDRLVTDVDRVASSAYANRHFSIDGVESIGGGFDQFTGIGVDSVDVSKIVPAIQKAVQVFRDSGQARGYVELMSDAGVFSDGADVPAALDQVPSNLHIWTVAVGKKAVCTGMLQSIADRTGGQCSTPKNQFGGGPGHLGDLPGILANLLASKLTGISVAVDGGAPTPVTDVTPALPVRGPASVTYRASLNSLPPGRHSICVTAAGADSGGNGSVSDCRNVVVDTPPTADPGGPYSGLQGTDIPIKGSATDPDSSELSTQWSAAPAPGMSPDAACTFADGTALATTVSCNAPGQYALTLTANDGQAPPVTAGTTLTITNAPAQVSAGGPYTGTAGVPVSLAGQVVDPDSPGLVATWTVTAPPGSPAPPIEGEPSDQTPPGPPPCTFTNPASVTTEITCPTPGPYTLTLTVTEPENEPVTATAPLTIVPVTVPVGSVALAATVTPAAGFVGGDPVIVTYTVRNDGEIPMPGLRLTTALPAALAHAVPAPAVLTPAGGPVCRAGGTGCDLGTLQPGQRRTVRFAVPATAAMDGRITARLTTTGQDANAKDNTAEVRVQVRQPALLLNPGVGHPGEVVQAIGHDFPAGARIRLVWSIGVSQPGVIVVGRDGTFTAQILVFARDQLGGRELAVQIVRGPRFGQVTAPFLVQPRELEPPFTPK